MAGDLGSHLSSAKNNGPGGCISADQRSRYRNWHLCGFGKAVSIVWCWRGEGMLGASELRPLRLLTHRRQNSAATVTDEDIST